MKKLTSIILDSDSTSVRRLESLLMHFPEVRNKETFNSAEDAEYYLLKNEVDLLFVDVELPGKSGLELVDTIRSICPNTKAIYVTAHEHYAIKAIKQRVFDYLLKPIDIDELSDSINRFLFSNRTDLSAREKEIIRLIALGMNSKDIAEKLHLSRHTIDTHRRRILQKTGTKNTADLIRFAVEKKLT